MDLNPCVPDIHISDYLSDEGVKGKQIDIENPNWKITVQYTEQGVEHFHFGPNPGDKNE